MAKAHLTEVLGEDDDDGTTATGKMASAESDTDDEGDAFDFIEDPVDDESSEEAQYFM
jgi:hypothetical protein